MKTIAIVLASFCLASTALAQTAPAPAAKGARTPAPAASENAVFPSAVNPRYSRLSPSRARLHTCRDQYKANRATNANGSLRWIGRGGYWALCDKHLKGI